MRSRKYDEVLLQCCLDGQTVAQTMKATGLSKKTICEYRADRDFQNELARRRVAAVQAAVSKMSMSLSEIVEVVIAIAKDDKISAQIRLNAAQILLSQCRNWTETADILTRLEAIETAINGEKVSS
ncbi:MAG: hypothetical protein LUC98_08645 [Lachnospiraceae bacterium]|nr:hypothetical protein [Lachnospiraceae bacterium]